MNVTLGAHDINKKENTQQVIPVLQAIRHENFNTETFTNDVMLLKLKYKAQLHAYVDTIALPHSEDWGDAGGPLVCNNVSQGMVSYGHVDGKPPQVFTRISSFVPWIKRTIKQFEHR
ncbi:mast cell protease 8-like [Castor canadensis]|uniref:Mast cell protease 8-like n=1 Tax=Castor canadensis TaxID=51338 RepID=A0AC58M4R0_CASCN